ncbi:MAG: Crp/Fnr family transcriptional regulator, partial [Mucilaginibacter sp.]|nr:Crp/Fnr family transcriptional regulator [Mucilaginibacter sp.]
EFPQLGSGGRTAMAGPVYYTDMFNKATAYPEYYNKKMFFYEWVRGWIKVISMQPNGDYDKMEPFMPNTKFNAPIDMELGPDGKIYVLEYGNGWFAKNKDAGLARIDYNTGNRAPEIKRLTANKSSGKLPFTVMLSVAAKDPENDGMSYTWSLGNGVTKNTRQPFLSYTYTKKGNYTVSVVAKDDKNAASESKTVSIYAGNDATAISATLASEQKMYGAGKILMMSLDCKGCHKVEEKSVGPSFVEVAKRYPKTAANEDKLAKKIMAGGTGVWGDVVMPAHPALKPAQAKQIVDWIFSLSGKK